MKQIQNVLHVVGKQIPLKTIKYVEGDGNYSILHLTDCPSLLIAQTVTGVEAYLPGFVRIHKKYLVNPQFALAQPRPCLTELRLNLTTGECLVVSRRRMTQIISALS